MIVVCDSSVLIPLSLINQLHLLENMYGGVLISRGIYIEVVGQGSGRAGAQAVRDARFIRVEAVSNGERIEQYTDRLSRQDAELIILAKEQNADLLITRDRGLRRRARQEGLDTITLWNFLVDAKESNVISAVKSLLDDLRESGMLIREGVYRETLRQAGELSEDE